LTRFTSATLDELWLRGLLAERRLSCGEAVHDARGIIATDTHDEALVAACTAEMERLRQHVLPDARMRLVAEATPGAVSATMTVTLGGHSIVTAPEHLANDLVLLRQTMTAPVAKTPLIPTETSMVWRNGTGSILLHEALGHAREHDHAELAWPSWLAVDVPLTERRASFRDVPLLRMTTLIARQNGAPFALDDTRIEVLLIDGGAYDPLTEIVTIRVAAADLIDGSDVFRLPPFELVRPRRQIAASLAGAMGEPVRYPGVICSREGQELVVGSYAPVMVTR
jgi:hypothetical protein